MINSFQPGTIVIFLCFVLFILFLNLSLLFAWRKRNQSPPVLPENGSKIMGWKKDELQMRELSVKVEELKSNKSLSKKSHP